MIWVVKHLGSLLAGGFLFCIVLIIAMYIGAWREQWRDDEGPNQ